MKQPSLWPECPTCWAVLDSALVVGIQTRWCRECQFTEYLLDGVWVVISPNEPEPGPSLEEWAALALAPRGWSLAQVVAASSSSN